MRDIQASGGNNRRQCQHACQHAAAQCSGLFHLFNVTCMTALQDSILISLISFP
jgi:hypothetical protein